MFDLDLGDVVQHLGTDYVVEGVLRYQSDGTTWLEVLLGGGQRDRWLSVEEDDRVVVALLEEVRDLEIRGGPPQALEHRGVRYRLRESGSATVERRGETGRRQTLSCDYWDYESEAGEVLSIEDWGGEREVTQGRTISPRALTILPGEPSKS